MAIRTLKYPVIVWYHVTESQYYAYPLGLKDPWFGTATPLIDDASWQFKGVLPAGLPVSNVQPDASDRIACTVAGKSLVTGALALE